METIISPVDGPKSQTIAIMDYGMGNLHSVASALHAVEPTAEILITPDSQTIANADRVVFPGVGAIRDCMAAIKSLGVDTIIRREIASGKPVLGICVGMQVLLENSEENDGIDCLGVFSGHVRFIGKNLHNENGEHLKVPHMGWNQVKQVSHPLWQGIDDQSRFYFVHSYHADNIPSEFVVGECTYHKTFPVALAKGNLFAVQFHPEKSHDMGLQLLKNFTQWDGNA